MSTKLQRKPAAIVATEGGDQLPGRDALAAAGDVADRYVAAGAFAEYVERKSENTIKAQAADLANFAEYLGEATAGAFVVSGEELQTLPTAWAGMKASLIEGYIRWLLRGGYAVATVNRRLATVRGYLGLATKAGTVDPAEKVKAEEIHAYTGKDARNVDEKRTAAGVPTRMGEKKAEHTKISEAQAAELMDQPRPRRVRADLWETPARLRDRVLMCLLLEHGLRAGELADLDVEAIDLDAGAMTFYRRKVHKEQTHDLGRRSWAALRAYLAHDGAPTAGPLLIGSYHGGQLSGRPMSRVAISMRVKRIGESYGIPGLSAHDARHWWATKTAQEKDPYALRDAGGWSSLEMPSHYVDQQTTANAGIRWIREETGEG